MQLLCKGNIFNAVGSLYGCCEVCMCSINVGEVECITPSDDVFTGYIGIVGDEQVLQLFKGVSRKCSFADLAVILELFSGADCTEGDGNVPCLSTEAAAIEDCVHLEHTAGNLNGDVNTALCANDSILLEAGVESGQEVNCGIESER